MLTDPINPNQGTRQYHNAVGAHIPMTGYFGTMEAAKIEALASEIRQKASARRLTQELLAERINASQSQIQRIWTGKFKTISQSVAQVLDLLDIPRPALAAQIIQPGLGLGEMQVYAAAAGGDEAVILTDPIETVPRPSYLATVRGAYGVRIAGQSMLPAFRAGDIAFVHPHLTPLPDDDVVLQDESQSRGIIKNFIRSTDSEWKLRQWNPKRDLSRAKKDWPLCHVVVGKQSRR